MTFYHGHDERLRHVKVAPFDGEKETPTDAFRPLIAAAAERLTDYGPHRLEAALRAEGHSVPIEQIRGFLAGM